MDHTTKIQDAKSLSDEKKSQEQDVEPSQTASGSETIGHLRKRYKRTKESRDLLKDKNREKSNRIKANSGKIDDLEASRNL